MLNFQRWQWGEVLHMGDGPIECRGTMIEGRHPNAAQLVACRAADKLIATEDPECFTLGSTHMMHVAVRHYSKADDAPWQCFEVRVRIVTECAPFDADPPCVAVVPKGGDSASEAAHA